MRNLIWGEVLAKFTAWLRAVWPWILASSIVLGGALKLHLAIAPTDIFAGFLLVGVVLFALECTHPTELRRRYRTPGARFLLWASLVVSTIAMVEHFLLHPSGEPVFVGNILPYSDAGDYFNGVRSLLNFGKLDEWCSRRPTATILYAVLYALAGQDLIGFYTLVALLMACSTAWAASQITSAWGMGGALAFCSLVLGAYGSTAGTFMSESAGLIMGCIAVGALVRGFSRNHFLMSCLGLGTLALAVLTRAGAIFAVPLVAAQLLVSQHQSLRQTWRNVLRLGAVVGVFLGAIFAATRIVVHPNATFQGNFSYTLYGLAAGGKGWKYVLTQHQAELHGLSDGEASRKIFHFAFEKIQEDPTVLLRALWSALSTHLMNPAPLLYPFTPGFSPALWFVLSTVALGILLTGWPKARYPGFLLFGALGVVLSAPFLADGGARVLVATVPLVSALLAFAFGRLGGTAQAPPAAQSTERDWAGVVPALMLAAVLVVAPLVFRALGNAPLPAPSDKNEYLVRIGRNTGSLVVADGMPLTRRRDLHWSDFKGQRGSREIQLMSVVRVGNYLTNGFFLSSGGSAYLLFDQDPGFSRSVRLRIRGEKVTPYIVHVGSFEEF
ncbi:MAG: hypothetical protein SFV15_14075 [Polyangiaceae bacterium]|nr:hypothetical protein [Polyangiaceae bacterium]